MTIAAGLRAHADLAAFYARSPVRARIAEFLGMRDDGGRPSATALAGYGGGRWLRQPGEDAVGVAWDGLPALLESGADVLRSRSDREGTLLVLDLEYAHPADPAEPLREPVRCFELLEPAHRAVLACFARLGVRPLVLMTPAGYQYLARAPLGSGFHAGLAEAGRAPDWRRPPRVGAPSHVGHHADRGAARLLQLVVHRTLRDVGRVSLVPVRLADLPPPGGGPFLRLDTSGYADGPDLHFVRCAFSSDQTPLVTHPGAAVPFVVVLPRREEPFRDVLARRADLDRAALHAEHATAAIPDVVDGADWRREYDSSALAAFHREMDRAPAAEWAYRPSGALDPESFPPCVSAALRYPSPALLHPRQVRTVALALSSLGWHPRAVAALIDVRYEEPHDWGSFWERHDRALRAEFFVRLFCAAAADGLEDGGGFGCGSASQLGRCPTEGCGYDLGLLFLRRRRLQVRNEMHA